MKKLCLFAVIGAVSILTGCSSDWEQTSHYLHNQSGEAITITHIVTREVENDSYGRVLGYRYKKDEPVNIEASFNQNRDSIYITYKGVTYLVDESQKDGCAWAENYSEATAEDLAKLKNQIKQNEKVRVFRLTEDYIKKQIVIDQGE